MTNHIKLFTHLIHPEGTQFDGEFSTEGLLPEGNNPMFYFTSPATYKIFCNIIGSSCYLNGAVAAKGRATCSSCLEEFDIVLRSPEFSRYYEEIPADGEIDITSDLEEELLIEVPDFPKCSETCKGLCPQCGCNLNLKTCDCEPLPEEEKPSNESPWGALDGL